MLNVGKIGFLTGILTVVSITTTIVFFSGAIFVKRKFEIEAPILSLISGILCIPLTVGLIVGMGLPLKGALLILIIRIIGAVTMGIRGIMLLSGHITKLKTMFVKAS